MLQELSILETACVASTSDVPMEMEFERLLYFNAFARFLFFDNITTPATHFVEVY